MAAPLQHSPTHPSNPLHIQPFPKNYCIAACGIMAFAGIILGMMYVSQNYSEHNSIFHVTLGVILGFGLCMFVSTILSHWQKKAST